MGMAFPRCLRSRRWRGPWSFWKSSNAKRRLIDPSTKFEESCRTFISCSRIRICLGLRRRTKDSTPSWQNTSAPTWPANWRTPCFSAAWFGTRISFHSTLMIVRAKPLALQTLVWSFLGQQKGPIPSQPTWEKYTDDQPWDPERRHLYRFRRGRTDHHGAGSMVIPNWSRWGAWREPLQGIRRSAKSKWTTKVLEPGPCWWIRAGVFESPITSTKRVSLPTRKPSPNPLRLPHHPIRTPPTTTTRLNQDLWPPPRQICIRGMLLFVVPARRNDAPSQVLGPAPEAENRGTNTGAIGVYEKIGTRAKRPRNAERLRNPVDQRPGDQAFQWRGRSWRGECSEKGQWRPFRSTGVGRNLWGCWSRSASFEVSGSSNSMILRPRRTWDP